MKPSTMYIINASKMRTICDKIARSRNTTLSAIMIDGSIKTSAFADSIKRFEKSYKDVADFELDKFTDYGACTLDRINRICTAFELNKEDFILQEIKVVEKEERKSEELKIENKELLDALSEFGRTQMAIIELLQEINNKL